MLGGCARMVVLADHPVSGPWPLPAACRQLTKKLLGEALKEVTFLASESDLAETPLTQKALERFMKVLGVKVVWSHCLKSSG